MSKSYDEFYFRVTKKNENIEILNKYLIEHKNLGNYQDNMFCPECKEAELLYVSKTSKCRAYLKRKISSRHTTSCSYQFDYASKSYVNEYFKDLSDNQIKDKLDAMMRSLFSQETHEAQSMVKKGVTWDEHPLVLTKDIKKQVHHKILRRKNIQQWLDKEIENELYLFYGKVRLNITNWTSKRDITIYFLNISCENSNGEWKKKISIYLGNKVSFEIEEGIDYYFVAIGCLEFPKGYPPKLKLASKQAFSIKKN